ncbi:MAG TPA: hypothetical protein VME21_13865 [Steroidobacteraceae bacterium]|nr:hypothetical protein [Steroidobacteraceae bacterium]
MQPESGALRVAVLLGAAALAGCSSGMGLTRNPSPPADTTPVVDRSSTSAALLASYLDVLQRLLQAPPAEQAEILAAAQRDVAIAPTPSHQLRYALVLATPGHAGFDLTRAQQLLREVLATPETLLPSERALAQLTLQTVDRQLTLAAENQRLRADAEHSEHERLAAANRRAQSEQSEQEENARLRKELEEARAKLDAIANIERSLSKRKTGTEGSTQ